MSKNNCVTQSSLYIAVAISLLTGFLAGVAYTIYKAPEKGQQTQSRSPGIRLAARIAQLEKLTKQQPDNAESWANLGHAYFDSNQFAQAITAYNKSLDIRPGNADLLTDLGVMYRRNQQPEKAIEAFNRAIKENQKHEQARFNKGVILLNDLHDTAGAVQVWEELLQLNPQVRLPSGTPLTELIQKIKKQQKK